MSEVTERAAKVQLLIMDVDGVLTDGRLIYGPSGEALKTFDVKDGHGLVLMRIAGVETAILSARQSEIVRARAGELAIRRVIQGQRDKLKAYERLLADTGRKDEEVAYVADDVNDLEVLARVGLACAPADAVEEVRRQAHLVTRAPGGRGAVREVCEVILKARGLWPYGGGPA